MCIDFNVTDVTYTRIKLDITQVKITIFMNLFCCNLKHFDFVQKQHSCISVFLVRYKWYFNGFYSYSIHIKVKSRLSDHVYLQFTA